MGGTREQYEQLEYTEPVTVESRDLIDHLREIYIDGTLYYDRQSEDARLTALKKEKSDLAAGESAGRGRAVIGTEPREEAAIQPGVKDPAYNSNGGAAVGTSGQGAAQGGAGVLWAIVNARIHPITTPTIERSTIVVPSVWLTA